jgi:AraC-like DNA-binding protein
MSARDDDDLTGAALVALMRLSFGEQGLLLPAPIPTLTANRPHASLLGKTQLADAVLAAYGPAALLRVGRTVPRLSFDPIGAALLAAPDGPELFARWSRLERYVHLRHPIHMADVTPTSAKLVHRRAAADPPSPAVDLLLSGVLAGLLAAIGCRNIRLSIGDDDCQVIAIEDDDIGLNVLPAHLATETWFYRWTQPIGAHADPPCAADVDQPDRLANRVRKLFQDDLLKRWSLAAVARRFNLSTRTLQRRLADEGLNLQALRCAAQVERATEMLLTTSHSLTTIGYACGFADSAHFTRIFKAVAGMPPATYRAASPRSG